MPAKYKAFISYTHADESWARWLQRGLERYRVPPRLIDALEGERDLPRRLFPIFRDRSELSSSSDLGSALQQSLADSEYLVLVCSPAAARSRWLNAEVRYFRALGRSDRILCFVVDGELDVDHPDCAFPPALLESEGGAVVEPLAADPRSDGKRDALLKIVGGLLALGIDDLKQRDAQRRARVWGMVAGASAVLAVAMVGLALYAVAARHEAELRRGQAENLIGFMLGDLRGKLERIGRLDILDSVGDASMEYFAALDENATAEDLLSRAMALRQIGEVRFNQGRLEPALQSFSESREVLRSLHDLDPSVNDYLFELGQSEFWVGYVYYERAELEAALEAMTRYLDISEELLERQPENPDYLAEVGYAYGNLGSVARKRQDPVAAIRYFEGAATIAEQQLNDDPDDATVRADLAESYSWLGSAHESLGGLEQSVEAYRRSLDQWQTLVASGYDERHRERLGSTALLLAGTYELMGDLDIARRLIDQAATEFTELLALDAGNARWRARLAVSFKDRAQSDAFAGDLEAAVPGIEEALRQLGALAAEDPTNGYVESQIADSLRVKAQLLAAAGRLDEALIAAGEALQRATALAPGNTRDATRSVIEFTACRARLLDRAGRNEDARALRRSVFDALWRTKPANPHIMAPLAEIALALNETETAEALISGLRAMGFADPTYTEVLGLAGSPP